eukprot:m.180987 g.180987  ORF g.180987 m.180987 type:complete len:127 (+) comp16624_c0_seq9:91-471(+)
MIGVGIILIRVVFVCFLLFFFLVLFFSFPFPSPFSSFFFTPLLSFPSFPPSFLLSVSLFFLYQLFIPHSIHKMATLNAPIAYDKSAYIITVCIAQVAIYASLHTTSCLFRSLTQQASLLQSSARYL